MKAVRSHVRGGPESLVYEEAPIPRISAGEILVRVHAAAITPTEFTWNSTWTRKLVLQLVFEPALRGASTTNVGGR